MCNIIKIYTNNKYNTLSIPKPYDDLQIRTFCTI